MDVKCGDFLGVTCGTWLDLWSGGIGAFVGAAAGIFGALLAGILSAGVALLVVWLTNQHQTNLQNRQMAESTKQANFALARQQIDQTKALREQRSALERQLDEQRRGLTLQLEEQRQEAAKVRVYAAVSDIIAAVELGRIKVEEGEVFEDAFVALQSAVIRWCLDSDSVQLNEELRAWPHFLWGLQKDAHMEHLWDQAGRPAIDEPKAARDRLNKASAEVSATASLWHIMSEDERSEILQIMQDSRVEISARSAAFREKVSQLLADLKP